MEKLKIEYVGIDTIKPYEKNAKQHPAEQIEQIKRSIEKFGMDDPIGIWHDTIVEGHGRLIACKELGMVEVPIIRLDHLTDEERKAYTLAHNKLTMNSDFDIDILRTELENLKELDFDLELTGFDVDELDDIFQAEEEQEIVEDDFDIEPPEEPKAKLGDIYQLGSHRLMCGDSTKEEDVAKLMNGVKADMIFTDPPYGMNLDTDYSEMKGFFGKSNKFEKVKGDNEDFKPELITTIFNNFKYCKEIFTWGADYYAEIIPNRNDGSWIVWDKSIDDSGDKMFGSNFELCYSKNKHKRELARVKWKGLFGMEKDDTQHRVHPTQKPSILAEWFINKYNKKDNAIIVDLYGGSGSTLIACEKTNNICYCMEYEPSYIDVIIQRWENFTGKKAVLIESKEN